MKSTTLLNHYREERNQLLRTITELLERDPKVRAAWLFGSIGRGDEDELSDIDLWVIVADDYVDKVIAQPHLYTSQVGSPILFLEAPQNAPEGGAYMMTCYDAPVAPHIVDWYWEPQTPAYIPGQVRLLFDKIGLTHKSHPSRFPERPAGKENIERPIHFISFFWMMLMIAAKYACRFPESGDMTLLPHLVNSIIKAQHFLQQENLLLPRNLPPHRSPGDKVRLLYLLADEMSKLMVILSKQGEEVPALITPGVYRYLNLIDLILEDKGW